MDKFKLDYKKVLYVGLAFFLIQIFWQTYDSLIAKILIDKFGLTQTWSGLIMALDNILALFMLPLFGLLSDKTKTRRGKRTPYILVGTIIAAVSFASLSFMDANQTKLIEQANITTEYNIIYEQIQNKEEIDWDSIFDDLNQQGYHSSYEKYQEVKNDKDIREQFRNRETADVYYDYLSIRAFEVTKANNFVNFVLFIVLLLVVLIAMSSFRSPAVALMPDVTLKSNRSKANAVINLMGSAAAVVSILLLTVFGLSKKSYVYYTPAFIGVAVVMLIALAVFLWKVNEPKMLDEYNLLNKEYEAIHLTEEEQAEVVTKKLTKGEITSLFLILFSVFFWYMGYNAIISKLSDYAPKQLNMDFALPLLVAQGAAIAAFIPIGILSSKIGRKKMILAGVLLLTISFGTGFFLTENTSSLLYIVLALTGIAWATINVNSFPMAVELATGDDIGKYTGYYYAFSMAAQIITPILSGLLMDNFSRSILFPYAAIMVGISFVTMFFVRHGDVKGSSKGILESFDIED